METSGILGLLMVLLATARCALSAFHLPKLGGCPDYPAQQNFLSNIQPFLDTWYVQSSFDTEALQGKGRCMRASYKYNNISHVVFVSTQQFNEDNKMWEKLDGTASPVDLSKDEAKFNLQFWIPIFNQVSGIYSVLGTDFETYSIMHGCGSFWKLFHYDCVWLMSKKPELTKEEEEQFYRNTGKILEKQELKTFVPEKFIKVAQDNCKQ